ncbi:putative inactive tyrosine-protein kinase Wsck [Diabrotica virgifera virgifera]|uniref:Tyrosine-protein kinase Wsck n=1 Tax=Diabrotica virgifera virgifera TaxID=50390 RepID=A0A6P7G3T7_DIAVI|nr:putative inactive tyrosine-protein kinase Wsck [Diabrotica virgifera virgifera]
MLKFLLAIYMVHIVFSFENTFLGCYNDISPGKRIPSSIGQNRAKPECIKDCFSKYYRYSFIYTEGNCSCGNYLGEEVSNVTCSECQSETCSDSKVNLTDTYFTGNLVPGPPRNYKVTNITENHIRITWQEPESFVEITKYKIMTNVIHTYSSYAPISPEWFYSNDTFQTALNTLLPATKYNVTLSTVSPDGDGALVFRVIETKLDKPDSIPTKPKIIENRGHQLDVQLLPTPNNNGPVTAYRIIVVNEDANQDFDDTDLGSYHDANRNGLSYYIAAELNPKDINNIFTVGDGRTYGRYYNAPLDTNINYNLILALVSSLNGVEKVVYSNGVGTGSGVSILNVPDDQIGSDSPAVIIGLSVAIGLLTFMLIAGIIGFIILKSRVVNRRHRLSDNQELTLQGPMIEVENNGYIDEEEVVPVNHYRNLKQKVRTIPSSQLNVEPTNLLGVGRYGRVNSAILQDNDNVISTAAYTIQDKKMSQETRKTMLHDLDVLIKVGKHDNIICLIGMCETSQNIYVVLEHASLNLKDFLLANRDSLPGRFSTMSESQALDIAVQIAKGMAHLDSCKIIHKQLCARSVMISPVGVVKVSSYGIAQYFSHNKIPDYTRWTDVEVFKNHPHNRKSDVWSYACLLWEICALGGTPYGFVANNNEIPDKIMKGLRLPQLQYINDDMYQIMLDCWQLDFTERPSFVELGESLESLKKNDLIPYITFSTFPNFQYEQFYPDMELAVRPVF